jgi:hypothetical protein
MKNLLVGATLLTLLNSASHSQAMQEQIPAPSASTRLSEDISKRIKNTLSQTDGHSAIVQEYAQATVDLKKFVKTHTAFSGIVVLGLMGTKRTGSFVRGMVRQPLLVALAAVTTFGAQKTLSWIENAYECARPLTVQAKQKYDAAMSRVCAELDTTEYQA